MVSLPQERDVFWGGGRRSSTSTRVTLMSPLSLFGDTYARGRAGGGGSSGDGGGLRVPPAAPNVVAVTVLRPVLTPLEGDEVETTSVGENDAIVGVLTDSGSQVTRIESWPALRLPFECSATTLLSLLVFRSSADTAGFVGAEDAGIVPVGVAQGKDSLVAALRIPIGLLLGKRGDEFQCWCSLSRDSDPLASSSAGQMPLALSNSSSSCVDALEAFEAAQRRAAKERCARVFISARALPPEALEIMHWPHGNVAPPLTRRMRSPVGSGSGGVRNVEQLCKSQEHHDEGRNLAQTVGRSLLALQIDPSQSLAAPAKASEASDTLAFSSHGSTLTHFPWHQPSAENDGVMVRTLASRTGHRDAEAFCISSGGNRGLSCTSSKGAAHQALTAAESGIASLRNELRRGVGEIRVGGCDVHGVVEPTSPTIASTWEPPSACLAVQDGEYLMRGVSAPTATSSTQTSLLEASEAKTFLLAADEAKVLAERAELQDERKACAKWKAEEERASVVAMSEMETIVEAIIAGRSESEARLESMAALHQELHEELAVREAAFHNVECQIPEAQELVDCLGRMERNTAEAQAELAEARKVAAIEDSARAAMDQTREELLVSGQVREREVRQRHEVAMQELQQEQRLSQQLQQAVASEDAARAAAQQAHDELAVSMRTRLRGFDEELEQERALRRQHDTAMKELEELQQQQRQHQAAAPEVRRRQHRLEAELEQERRRCSLHEEHAAALSQRLAAESIRGTREGAARAAAEAAREELLGVTRMRLEALQAELEQERQRHNEVNLQDSCVATSVRVGSRASSPRNYESGAAVAATSGHSSPYSSLSPRLGIQRMRAGLVSVGASQRQQTGDEVHCLSSPYCTCELVGHPQHRFQTPVVQDCLDPVWNYVGMITDVRPCDALEFTLHARDHTGKRDTLLGRARVLGVTFLPSGFLGELVLQDACLHSGHATLLIEILPAPSAEAVDVAMAPRLSVPGQELNANIRKQPLELGASVAGASGRTTPSLVSPAASTTPSSAKGERTGTLGMPSATERRALLRMARMECTDTHLVPAPAAKHGIGRRRGIRGEGPGSPRVRSPVLSPVLGRSPTTSPVLGHRDLLDSLRTAAPPPPTSRGGGDLHKRRSRSEGGTGHVSKEFPVSAVVTSPSDAVESKNVAWWMSSLRNP
eukprot:TRINITY_DN24648_c0_g1_i2.p1 TRINITY_DN24648_c0_g1~~TRINITY_DN24648_c0_g1_i2.p1  ORF type:complete len:1172 (+),score=238.42 TRINITY_DN24648_c0_g1_i2:120-3635(+)